MILHVNDISNVGKTIVMGLREKGIEAELLCLPRLRGLSRHEKVLTLIRTIINVKAKAKKASVVHIHYGFYGMLGVLGGFSYTLHCHGSDLNVNLRDPILGPLTRMAIRKAQRVIYSTPDLKAKLLPLRSDAIFLPNPIDTASFRPVVREEAVDLKILSISRLNKVKGIDTVFEAFGELKASFPEIKVYSMGSGPDAEYWSSSTFIDGFFPDVQHEEMPAFINQFDIIIGQMASGAMGVSELEALACSKPVIVNFQYGGVYNQEPPILPATNSQGIVNWVLKLRDNRQLLSSLGQEGRQWVQLFHDTPRVTAKLEDIYDIKYDR